MPEQKKINILAKQGARVLAHFACGNPCSAHKGLKNQFSNPD